MLDKELTTLKEQPHGRTFPIKVTEIALLQKHSMIAAEFTVSRIQKNICAWKNCLRKINSLVYIHIFKVNNRNTITKSKLCSKKTTKTPESGVFIVNFEYTVELM